MKDLQHYRKKFSEHLKKNYALRLHMSMILLATVCAGLLATKLLHLMHMENVAIRYPLSVVFSYLVFFGAVKIWLLYIVPDSEVQTSRYRSGRSSSSSSSDLAINMPVIDRGGGQVSSAEAFQAGDSGGGGADASFDTAGAVGEGGSAISGDGAGEALSDLADGVSGADEGGAAVIIAFVVLAIILAAIVGVGVYMIYSAPLILSEAAFQVFLAAGLIRGTRRMENSDWIGSVFRATWISFAVTLLLALAAGLVIHVYFPSATSLTELYRML